MSTTVVERPRKVLEKVKHSISTLLSSNRRLPAITGWVVGLALLAACRDPLFKRSPGRPPDVAHLASDLVRYRFTVPRLTGLRFGRCNVSLRGESSGMCLAPPKPGEMRWNELARITVSLERCLEKAPTPAAVRARGLAHLAWAEADQAVIALQQAKELAPADAAIANDLGVALWLRAVKRNDPRDIASALGAFEVAGRVPEALYNRALLLSNMGLFETARRAWGSYLTMDPSSRWADEGREQLRLLESFHVLPWNDLRSELHGALGEVKGDSLASLVARHPEACRNYLDIELLGGWAKATVRGNPPEATRKLAQARLLAVAFERAFGDRGALDATAWIAAGSLETESSDLVAGHVALADGLAFIEAGDFATAAQTLRIASQKLVLAGSPYAARSELDLLRCLYQQHAHGDVLAGIAELLAEVTTEAYPDLIGRALWLQGTTQMVMGRLSEALQAYKRSLAIFEASGDEARQGALHVLVASAYGQLGDLATAWVHRLQALKLLGGREDDRWLGHAIAESMYGALQLGETFAALALQDEALALAQEDGSPVILAIAHRHRAEILYRLDRRKKAEAALAQAAKHAQLIPDPEQRLRTLADIHFDTARLLRRSDPAQAIAILTNVLKRYRQAGIEVLFPWVLHERALAWLNLGDIESAERDLTAAVDDLDRLRSHRLTIEHRLSFIEGFLPIYSDLIRLQIEEGYQPENVLDTLERLRARLLLDRLSSQIEATPWVGLARKPQPLHDLMPQLAERVAFLVYHTLPDRLVIGLLRKEGVVALETVSVEVAQLSEEIEFLGGLPNQDRGEAEALLSTLHKSLIGPVASHLVAGETLVVVPEGPLYAIPFGALFDPVTGRFLIEDHPIAISPSLNVMLQLEARRVGQKQLTLQALVLADPAFERDLFPGLGRLSGAEWEGREIVRLLPDSTLLAGQHATPNTLLRNMGSYPIIHVAAHAIADPDLPLLSRLALAPDKETSGVLYASELLGTSLEQVELVVLGACQSAGNGPVGSEGVAGLVWPLLAGGVAQVIATVHSVDDKESSRLLVDFYGHLADYQNPLAALRAAQLAAIDADRNRPAPTFTWAAFQFYGAPPHM